MHVLARKVALGRSSQILSVSDRGFAAASATDEAGNEFSAEGDAQ
jgi:hypothetical protein